MDNKKPPNLKAATHLLKAEALRRYKHRHRDDSWDNLNDGESTVKLDQEEIQSDEGKPFTHSDVNLNEGSSNFSLNRDDDNSFNKDAEFVTGNRSPQNLQDTGSSRLVQSSLSSVENKNNFEHGSDFYGQKNNRSKILRKNEISLGSTSSSSSSSEGSYTLDQQKDSKSKIYNKNAEGFDHPVEDNQGPITKTSSEQALFKSSNEFSENKAEIISYETQLADEILNDALFSYAAKVKLVQNINDADSLTLTEGSKSTTDMEEEKKEVTGEAPADITNVEQEQVVADSEETAEVKESGSSDKQQVEETNEGEEKIKNNESEVKVDSETDKDVKTTDVAKEEAVEAKETDESATDKEDVVDTHAKDVKEQPKDIVEPPQVSNETTSESQQEKDEGKPQDVDETQESQEAASEEAESKDKVEDKSTVEQQEKPVVEEVPDKEISSAIEDQDKEKNKEKPDNVEDGSQKDVNAADVNLSETDVTKAEKDLTEDGKDADGKDAIEDGKDAIEDDKDAIEDGEIVKEGGENVKDNKEDVKQEVESSEKEENDKDGKNATEEDEKDSKDATKVESKVVEVKDSDEKKEETKEDEENAIPKDFYYETLEFQSGSRVSENSGIPPNTLQCFHSFGYDSKKRSNLYLLPGPTALFAAGNLVILLDLKTGSHKYIRSCSGGGIGAFAVHPSQQFFAVAEKGKKPHILIYEYPSLKLYRILRGGTERAYSFVDFNPKGDLLASVGSAPDYMLTVWDWMKENIMLRSKAFSQDIFRVKFSPEQEGQLTSSGTGHIRFWKMAKTFTGLKLKGELGRFGKTSLTDIDGYTQLPDGKVLSGTEWGNMLLWDGGLIKVEICRKQNNPCHKGTIEQLVMDEGELITIGLDGYVRVWEMESIDTADTTDDSDTFEIEPMNELLVGNDVQLTKMVKLTEDSGEETSDELASIWYAQDANGGIWKLDLSFAHTTKPPEKVFTYIGDVVHGLTTSPVSHLMAVTGDSSVNVYDYLTNSLLCSFKAPKNSYGRSLFWPGKLIDTKGTTIMAGYSDGVIRIFNFHRIENTSQLTLKQVEKPHISDVTVIVADNEGEILATGSKDNTVFFFSISDKIEPIGFVSVPGPVSYMQWSPEGFANPSLLVTCENGYVVEIMSPVSQAFDTTKSFKLSTIPLRYFKINSIKSRLRRDEERERRNEAKAQRRKQREKDLKRRKDAGEEISAEDAQTFLDTDTVEDPEEESLYFPPEPCPVLLAKYTGQDQFMVSMGGYDAGYLYECKFTSEEAVSQNLDIEGADPFKAIPIRDSDDVPITSLHLSGDLGRVYAGFENGMLRVYPLEEKLLNPLIDLDVLDTKHWEMNIHDNDTGHVCNIVESYDCAYLFSSGGDGNIFGFNVLPYENIHESMAGMKARLPSAKKPSPDDKGVDDIDDPKAYSIEDAKLKAEHDKMMREAEAKKMAERRKIAKLRRTFKELLQKNEQLPRDVQLKREEFELDPSIRQKMVATTNENIERVKLEMQWDKERYALAHRKLHERFRAQLDCDRITVHAFKSTHTISSYRVEKLSDEYYKQRNKMEEKLRANSLTSDGTDPNSFLNGPEKTRQITSDEDQKEPDSFIPGAKQKQKQSLLHGRQAEKVAKALKKAEEAKKKRDMRQKEWAELYKNKPDENFEDPVDVAAIREAQENMGDFKLKTASDYSVPEHLRMDTEKKRYQILVLQGLIYQAKSDFNDRLLELRDNKASRIELIQQLVKELKDVQSKLRPDQRKKVPKVPRMKPSEEPHKKYEYTRDTLLKFQEEEKSRETAAAQKKRQGDGGFFGGFGDDEKGEEEEDGSDGRARTYTTGSMASSVKSAQKMEHAATKTDLEHQMHHIEEIKAKYHRDRLLKQIEEELKSFDAELRLMRHSKTSIDIDIKMADLREITLLEELLLLKEYEKRELNLSGRVTGKKNELMEMNNKVAETQQKYESKRRDIEKLSDREKALYANFSAALGDNNKFAEFLTKVFKKKIKRTKKKATTGDDEDEDSDMSSDEESDWSSDEDEDDSMEGGFDDSVCPPGCDQQLFDDVLMFREKRLDLEEMLVEEKKVADQLKKEVESQAKKSKIMEGQLKTALGDLAAFQVEKQGKLNELNVVVPLRLHQVEHVANAQVPADLSPCLVFTNHSLTALQRRIKELQHEKMEEKKLYRDARLQHVRLIKERKLIEDKIERLDGKCEQMMMLKFGRTVDLEKLEAITVNKTVEELKEKLRLNDIQNSKELSKWDKRIRHLKDRVTQLTRENTARLERLNVLISDKATLEMGLDKRQKTMELDTRTEKKSDVRERQRLVQLVQLQAQEIQALKEEIGLLSRKGGHILPPAQPPLGQDQEVM